MHTYVHPFTPAVEPLGESKTDWQIFRDLAAKIQELAADRGTEPVDDRKFDRQIDLQSVHDDYVRDWLDDEPGALSEDKAAAEFIILENSEETNPEGTDEQITFDEIDEQPKRLLETGDHWSSDIEEGEAYTPWKDYVQDKNPWPTFTGRQQYYIDHDWFLARRAASDPQGGAGVTGEVGVPAGVQHAPQPLVDPLDVARQQQDAPAAARRADRLPQPRRRRGAGIEDGDTVRV